jgi:hypothetical protein
LIWYYSQRNIKTEKYKHLGLSPMSYGRNCILSSNF